MLVTGHEPPHDKSIKVTKDHFIGANMMFLSVLMCVQPSTVSQRLRTASSTGRRQSKGLLADMKDTSELHNLRCEVATQRRRADRLQTRLKNIEVRRGG